MNPISPTPMNDQERKMLQEIIDISRENNTIVHKLLRAQHSATLWKIIYWTVIIGGLVAGYYSVQPYLQPLMQVYSKFIGAMPR